MNPFLSRFTMLFARPFLFFISRKAHAKLIIERKRIDRTLFVLEDFCAFTMFHKFRYFFDARRLVSSLAHSQRWRSKSSDTFLRVSLRLDKPSEDRLVLTKVEKNIFMLAARVRRL